MSSELVSELIHYGFKLSPEFVELLPLRNYSNFKSALKDFSFTDIRKKPFVDPSLPTDVYSMNGTIQAAYFFLKF